MGRAKLKLDIIHQDKKRHSTYKKRKNGLFKKLQEFTILCDVKACMIVYGPNSDSNPPPEIWPEDSSAVNDLIRDYMDNKQGNKDEPRSCIVAGGGIRRTTNLIDFFKNRTKKLYTDIVRLRRRIREKQFPPSVEPLQGFSYSQLRQLVGKFDHKLQEVHTRINFLKEEQLLSSSHYVNNGILTNTNNSSMMEHMVPPSSPHMMNPMNTMFENHTFLENACNVEEQGYYLDGQGNVMMEPKPVPLDFQFQQPLPISCAFVPMNMQSQYQQQLEPNPYAVAQWRLMNGAPMAPMFGNGGGSYPLNVKNGRSSLHDIYVDMPKEQTTRPNGPSVSLHELRPQPARCSRCGLLFGPPLGFQYPRGPNDCRCYE